MFFWKKSGYQRWMEYWKRHPNYNSLIHFLGGMGFAWVMSPWFSDLFSGQALVGWGWLLVIVTVVGHIYPIFVK